MKSLKRYSTLSTMNHWISALLVVAMLVLGMTAAAAPSEAIEDYIIGVHISLGFFVLIFVVWRVLFRLYEGFPENNGKTLVERRAAYIVHRLILFLLVIQILTGPLYLFTENECMNVFGWFSVCLSLESLSMIHEAMEWIHKTNGLFILPILLLLHLAGAIRHFMQTTQQETPADM